MQRNRHSETSLGTSVVIIGSLLSLFSCLLMGKLFVKTCCTWTTNYRFRKDIEVLEGENKNLEQQLVYLRSPQYRDKWAKEHEGLMQPGEKVVYIEPHPVQDSLETAPNKIFSNEKFCCVAQNEINGNGFLWRDFSRSPHGKKSIDNETEKDGNSGEWLVVKISLRSLQNKEK